MPEFSSVSFFEPAPTAIPIDTDLKVSMFSVTIFNPLGRIVFSTSGICYIYYPLLNKCYGMLHNVTKCYEMLQAM